MGLVPEVRDNVRLTFYEAGHMMYVHQPSLVQLVSDLREFVGDTAS
jgi:carboxypeptidase C (cathepsin A)